jgi:hypothetical protein
LEILACVTEIETCQATNTIPKWISTKFQDLQRICVVQSIFEQTNFVFAIWWGVTWFFLFWTFLLQDTSFFSILNGFPRNIVFLINVDHFDKFLQIELTWVSWGHMVLINVICVQKLLFVSEIMAFYDIKRVLLLIFEVFFG